jgi:dTDP-4-amino-4,6-dideoxygalactose transaminase
VVEDNAHGLYGKYRGRRLGTFGQLATLSFHETKNFSCGEGGALLINDEQFNERAEILREKGTDRSRFFRGEVDKYTWVDVGSSYLPSDLLAAFLRAQLGHRDQIQSRRQQIWDTYARELASWAEANGVRLPIVPPECEQTYHMFYVIMPSFETRQALISHLAGLGILAVFHYLPLHLSPMGLRFGGRKGDCPVTEDLSDRILRFPFFTGMSRSEQSRVIDAMQAFRC